MDVAQPFAEALCGKDVSHVWRGAGSCICLEFGTLSATKRLNGDPGHPEGELSLLLEWSWRLEAKRTILGGAWSSERKWPKIFQRLTGAQVEEVQFFGHIPEIRIVLSNGLHVVSFNVSEGQPAWSVIARRPKIGGLFVQKGRLYVQPS